MVKHTAAATAVPEGIDLDAVFRALAHPIRRAIIERLAATGEATVGDLAAPHDVSAPAISKHLRALEEAGLLVQERDGRVRRCRLGPKPLQEAFGWLTRTRVFWEDRFDDLEKALAADDEGGPEPDPASSDPSSASSSGPLSSDRPSSHP